MQCARRHRRSISCVAARTLVAEKADVEKPLTTTEWSLLGPALRPLCPRLEGHRAQRPQSRDPFERLFGESPEKQDGQNISISEAMQGVYSLHRASRLFPNPGSKASTMQAGHVISTIEI
jgi:hypothetical protein